MEQTLLSSISQVGFPIVVSLLLLIRIENKMEKLGEKIEQLTLVVDKLSTIIDQKSK